MGFLRRVHSLTLRDKVYNCQIRKAVNVEPLLRIERSRKMDEASPTAVVPNRGSTERFLEVHDLYMYKMKVK